MDLTISPAPLCGSIQSIPSKSAAHRLLICATFADRETEICCPVLSKDICATADCLQAMGALIRYEKGSFFVKPIENYVEKPLLDCGESGSTLRFLLPIVCALGKGGCIKMSGRLPERPLSPLWEELEKHGVRLSRPEKDTILLEGKLQAGDYKIRADISSQFISGLLFALPLLEGESRIIMDGELQSAGYVRMTQQAQSEFSLTCPLENNVFNIAAGSKYVSPAKLTVEGDWSNAAFWLVADALSEGKIKVNGLSENSLQGDKAVLDSIERIKKGNAVIDVKDIPDLLPVLAVLAAVSAGETKFINAGRLRLKESDRLKAVEDMLLALGGNCEVIEDSLVIKGGSLRGGIVDSLNDHRIAMSAAVAAIACSESVTVIAAESVEKSYPKFFEDYKKLGGKVL